MSPYLSILEALLIVFSAIVLAYVSMTTSIGPWISPSIIIISSILLGKALKSSYSNAKDKTNKKLKLTIIQISSSLSGLLATAIGFTLPTLFFLDKTQFESLIASPVQFIILIGTLVFFAGMLGTLTVHICLNRLLNKEKQTFPVSKLIKNTIEETTDNHDNGMITGGVSGAALLLFRDGMSLGRHLKIPPIFPGKIIHFFPTIHQFTFPIMISPAMWAVGFTAGSNIIKPLLVGLFTREFALYPINHHAQILGIELFAQKPDLAFFSAFCGGLILFDLASPVIKWIITPATFYLKASETYQFICNTFSSFSNKDLFALKKNMNHNLFSQIGIVLTSITTIIAANFYGLSVGLASFMVLGSIFVSYKISSFVCRAGIAPFGRFITFMMLPALMLFTQNNFHTVFICVFSAIACAAGVNMVIQYKVVDMAEINRETALKHQIFGLITCTLTIGMIFLLLFKNLKLGTSELFAQRGQSRALLILSPQLDKIALTLGFLTGIIFKKLKLSSTMIFGGILMPKELITALIAGAFVSKLTNNSTKLKNFSAGAFAGESLFVILKLALKALPF